MRYEALHLTQRKGLTWEVRVARRKSAAFNRRKRAKEQGERRAQSEYDQWERPRQAEQAEQDARRCPGPLNHRR